MQPINGRLLVRLTSQYKHVDYSTDKQHQNAISEGVVIAEAADLVYYVIHLYGDGPKLFIPKLVGKRVRWDKFAEQNNTFDYTDPKTNEEFKAALIKYEDITAYEAAD